MIRHPQPQPRPEGFEPVLKSADLTYRWESAWGGQRLLGTEGAMIWVHNAGYALETLVLTIEGRDPAGETLFSVRHEVEQLATGEQISFEMPSWEMPTPAASLAVALESAVFGPAA
jgi:hypothetical protein